MPRALIVPLNFNFPPPLRFSRLASDRGFDGNATLTQLGDCSLAYAQHFLEEVLATYAKGMTFALHAYSGNLGVFVLREKAKSEQKAKEKDAFACYRRVGAREDSMVFPISTVREWFFNLRADDMLERARGNVSAIVDGWVDAGGFGVSYILEI